MHPLFKGVRILFAMQDARALLEALMGPARNQTAKDKELNERKDGKPEFADRKMCKRYLVAFCPRDWFTVNKRQLEPCTKVHSEYFKNQFEAHPDVERYKSEYEDEFLTYLEKLVADCEKWIERERIRCKERGAGGKRVILPETEQKRVSEMEARYAKLIKEAEEKAEDSGSATRAGELTEQAQVVKDLIDAVKARHTHEFPGEEVCEVCGIRYALAASAAADLHGKESHLNGKLHEGYTEIRRKVFELRDKKRQRDLAQLKKEEQDRENRHKERGERRGPDHAGVKAGTQAEAGRRPERQNSQAQPRQSGESCHSKTKP